jgi:hypothetical protein
VFGVNCDSGLFVVKLGEVGKNFCVTRDFKTNRELRKFGWQGNFFYADIDQYNKFSKFDGRCQYEWRQGIKHDCSSVMEFASTDEKNFINKLGEIYQFDLGNFIYPLVKSSNIKKYEINETGRYLLVPQKKVNEDTSKIQFEDCRIWDYLVKHKDYFLNRGSVIYKKAPLFAIFGVGDYSFSKFKVGISGFYKDPIFSLLAGAIPIMMDDTCYFLSFENISDALITLSLLNSEICRSFLKSLVFIDLKRPYTKEILSRIDLLKLSEVVGFDGIKNFLQFNLSNYSITKEEFNNYCSNLNKKQIIQGVLF